MESLLGLCLPQGDASLGVPAAMGREEHCPWLDLSLEMPGAAWDESAQQTSQASLLPCLSGAFMERQFPNTKQNLLTEALGPNQQPPHRLRRR